MSQIAHSFPKAFRSIVICNSEAVGFGCGDLDDMIAVKPLKKAVKSAAVFVEGKLSKSEAPSLTILYEHYRALLDRGSIGSFSLSKKTLEQVKRAVKKLDATHIRFHSNNDGVHLAIFDLRRFVPEARLKRKHEVMLVTDSISSQDRYRFSITISSNAIFALPNADCFVSVDAFEIARFSYEDGSFYLVRNQQVSPTLTTFVSDRLGKEIAFWLHPKSNSPDPRTTQ